MGKCQVCNQRESIGVACSGLGPMSLAYCGECSKNYAEPKEMVAFTIEDCGGLDQVRDDVKNTVTYFEDGKYILMKDYK